MCIRDSLSAARVEPAQLRYDLVLLDVMLPDGNGVDVARQLKSDPALADVFVILFSGTKVSSDNQARGLADEREQ